MKSQFYLSCHWRQCDEDFTPTSALTLKSKRALFFILAEDYCVQNQAAIDLALSKAESLFAQKVATKKKNKLITSERFPQINRRQHIMLYLINSHKPGNVSLYRGCGMSGEPEIWGEKSQKTVHRDYIAYILKLVCIFMIPLHLAHLAYHFRFYSEYFLYWRNRILNIEVSFFSWHLVRKFCNNRQACSWDSVLWSKD